MEIFPSGNDLRVSRETVVAAAFLVADVPAPGYRLFATGFVLEFDKRIGALRVLLQKEDARSFAAPNRLETDVSRREASAGRPPSLGRAGAGRILPTSSKIRTEPRGVRGEEEEGGGGQKEEGRWDIS